MTHRYQALDWLRGLLAMSIMLYHLTAWSSFQPQAGSVLGRLGIYGVSMFFVLSGLSIALVYHRFVVDTSSSGRFMVRRVFRIWPLLWLAVGAVWCIRFMHGEVLPWRLVAINLSTLFGFIRPGAYINAGAWSIGNEMVYYAFTPLLLMVYNRRRVAGNLLFAASIGLTVFWSGWLLVPNETLAHQWATYIHPLDNLFLYVAGIALYFNTATWRVSARTCGLIAAAALVIFVGWPAEGDQIALVRGLPRVALSVASIGLVFAFFKIAPKNVPMLLRPLGHLGEMTYGVYLLHPVVWEAIQGADVRAWPPSVLCLAVIAATLLLAHFTYRLLEQPFIALGKRLTTDGSGASATDALQGNVVTRGH